MSTLAEPQPQPQTGPDPVPQTPSSTIGTTCATSATAATCRCSIIHASSSSPAAPTNENENENEKTAALEAANVAFFDALSHDFDKRHPEAADGADRLARALRRVLALDENTTSVLDYACGSGQVSRALAPYVAQLVGVDISPRMVEVYNARANAQGLEAHEMRAVGSLAELDQQQQQQQQRFDVAVCSMAYHHFPSVQDVTREIVAHLKPRGTLAVADIARVEADEGKAPLMAKYEHIVAHTRGFTEEEMRALFEGAGLENVAFEHFTSVKHGGRDLQLFLATGTKPVE